MEECYPSERDGLSVAAVQRRLKNLKSGKHTIGLPCQRIAFTVYGCLSNIAKFFTDETIVFPVHFQKSLKEFLRMS